MENFQINGSLDSKFAYEEAMRMRARSNETLKSWEEMESASKGNEILNKNSERTIQ